MTSNIVFSEKKQKDMEWAKGIVSRIEADRRKFVKYKDSRPITDIKHMIETSAELYGDNTAFYQKYKGDETFTAISYRQMIEKVNGLGTASIRPDMEFIREELPTEPTDQDIKTILWEEVDKINKTAPLYRRIKKLILRKKEFIKNTSNKLVRFAEENKVE